CVWTPRGRASCGGAWRRSSDALRPPSSLAPRAGASSEAETQLHLPGLEAHGRFAALEVSGDLLRGVFAGEALEGLHVRLRPEDSLAAHSRHEKTPIPIRIRGPG